MISIEGRVDRKIGYRGKYISVLKIVGRLGKGGDFHEKVKTVPNQEYHPHNLQ